MVAVLPAHNQGKQTSYEAYMDVAEPTVTQPGRLGAELVVSWTPEW